MKYEDCLGKLVLEREIAIKAVCPKTLNSFSPVSGRPFSWSGFSKKTSDEANFAVEAVVLRK